jgi:A/G-specific adenine glycosylase
MEETYPRKAAKAERPTRYGAAFVAIRADGAVLLRQRGESGLLGGMSEVPGSDWTSHARGLDAILDAPVEADWRRVPAPVVHVFTHFRLELAVYLARVPLAASAPEGAWWSPPHELPGEALPSVMKKAIETALPGATKRQAKAA